MGDFNEKSLGLAIVNQWGGSSAHFEVFSSIAKKAQAHDDAILIVDKLDGKSFMNKKNGKEYQLIALISDSTNAREGNEIAVYLDSNGKIEVRDAKEFLKKFTEK